MNVFSLFYYPSILKFSSSILAVIFIISATGKIRNPANFTSTVSTYHLLPKVWIRPFAIILPWLELVLGLMLLLGWATRMAAITSIVLLLVFLAAMGINLARGRKDLDCGCSGKRHAQKISWKPIARNVLLILLSLLVAV